MLPLKTFLSETEAVPILRLLVYIGEELNDGTAITPARFLSPKRKIGALLLGTEKVMNDPD